MSLVDDYVLAHADGFPKSVYEYLTSDPTTECPLCPLCDHSTGDRVLDVGTDGYLGDLYESIQRGQPIICELCVHRAAHFAERHGAFGYLAIVEQCLSGTQLLRPFLVDPRR